MKMVKKILLGLVATATVIGLAGCKQIDDEKKAIDGSGNNYSVDYTNDGTGTYRAYKSTSLKHAGALVKVTFNEPNANNASKMGLIFDLHENADKSKSFYIIGLAGTPTANCYISKMENITDIQASNFGASTTATGTNPKETIIWNPDASQGIGSITRPAAVSDGSVSYYVYYKAFPNGTGDTTGKGHYEWGVFDFTEAQAETAKAMMKKENATEEATLARLAAIANGVKLQGGTISSAFDITGTTVPQNQIAVYANILEKKSLKGKWKFLDMYKEAEEIEE